MLEVNNFKTNLMCVQVGNVHIELIIVIDFDKNLHKVIPVLIWDVGNDGHIWINQIGWEYSPSPLFLASCRSLQVNSKRVLLEDCLTKISSILGTVNRGDFARFSAFIDVFLLYKYNTGACN